MNHLSLYEELLNLPSVKITAVKIDPQLVTINCQVTQKDQVCPNCGKMTNSINQYYERTLRDLNMGSKYVYLVVKMRQFNCQNCQRYFTETLPFADLNKEHTHRQTDYIFSLARKQSYSEVAAIVDVSPAIPTMEK